MQYSFPHTIENCIGEKLVFEKLVPEAGGDKLLVRSWVAPGQGPLMHTHWMQDECLTVVKGKLGYEIAGEAPKFVGEGESILFERGVPHRFWNAGDETMECAGWVQPANTIVFYLSSIYAAQNTSGNEKPEAFDAAYLLTRYADEYDLHGLPPIVKKLVIPMTYQVGRILGKYKKFRGAPAPLKKNKGRR